MCYKFLQSLRLFIIIFSSSVFPFVSFFYFWISHFLLFIPPLQSFLTLNSRSPSCYLYFLVFLLFVFHPFRFQSYFFSFPSHPFIPRPALLFFLSLAVKSLSPSFMYCYCASNWMSRSFSLDLARHNSFPGKLLKLRNTRGKVRIPLASCFFLLFFLSLSLPYLWSYCPLITFSLLFHSPYIVFFCLSKFLFFFIISLLLCFLSFYSFFTSIFFFYLCSLSRPHLLFILSFWLPQFPASSYLLLSYKRGKRKG